MKTKKTWVAVSILCGTLLTGILIGSGGTFLVLKASLRHHRPPEMGNVEMRKEGIKDFMLRRMQRKLDLDEAQTQLIKLELESMAVTLGEFHASVRAELGEMVDAADEVIKGHLTAEQVEIFEKEFVNRRKLRESRRKGNDRDFNGPHQGKKRSEGRQGSEEQADHPPMPQD